MKENEIDWKKLLWSLPEPLLICEKNGQITFANNSATFIFNEVEGQPISTLIPQLANETDFADWINQENQRLFETLINNTVRQVNWNCRVTDGNEQQQSLFLLQPEVKPTIVSSNNSTQQNDYELFNEQFRLSAKDSEILLSKLFRESPLGIALVDTETKHFTDCNATLIQILGYTKPELQQYTYFDITPKRYHHLDRIQSEAFYIAGRFGPYEKADIHKNGYPVQVLLHGLSFFKSDGNRMILVFVQDISEHSATKASLREYEDRVNLLFQETPEAHFITNMKGVLLDANKASEQLIGISKHKILGKSLLQLKQLPLSEVPKAASILAQNAIGKQCLNQHIVLDKDTGLKQIIELSTYPININNSRQILGIARDITAQQNNEQEIISERNKARRYLDIAGSIIIGFNRDLTVRIINQAGCQMAGKEKEDIIGKDWSVLLPSGMEREVIQNFLKKTFDTNSVPQEAIEAKIYTKDGIAHYFLWKNNLLFDENGVVSGLLSSGLNVTELKQAQNLLTDKELKTSRLNQLSQLALQMEDEKNGWIKLSEKLQELLQCDMVYITAWDQNSQQAIPLAAPAKLYDFYINYKYEPDQISLTQSVLEKGEALVIQNTEDTEHISQGISNIFKTKSGLGLPMIVGEQKLGAILVGFTSYHKFSATEVEWGILAANQIALALHKSLLINELKKSNEDKDRFFTMLSHDLKSPFSGIAHLITFMSENLDTLSDAECSEMLDTLRESTKNLNVLIDNILSWSRLNRGLMKLNPEQFALSELVEEVCNLLENQAREKKIILNKDIDPSINIEADREILKAVLRNLISNAIKFSYSEAYVDIKSQLTADKILLIVADKGVGITNENLEKLRRNDNIASQPGTANETGTGLGLLIIQEFVKIHQGQLLIQSKLQAGSTFTVELPRHTKTYG